MKRTSARANRDSVREYGSRM